MLTNFAIRSFLDNGVEFSWTDTTTPFDISLSAGPDVSNLQQVKTISPDQRTISIHFSELPPGDFGVFRLSATYLSGTTVFEDIFLNVKNTLRKMSGAIAVDGAGIPKALKVDDGGNLLVSGITINSTGHGDASASLQSQQLSSLNTIRSSVDSSVSAINAVHSKLSDVRLSTSQIFDLKSVSVTNHPSAYPAPATVSALNALSSIVATDQAVRAIETAIGALLRPSDLPRDINGNIVVEVANQINSVSVPAVHGELIDVNSNILDASSKLSSLNTLSDAIATDTSRIETSTSEISTNTASIAESSSNAFDSLVRAESLLSDIITNIPKEEQTDLIRLILDDILSAVSKPEYTDLNEIKTSVVNMPIDYPNAEAQTALGSILNAVSSINVKDVGITSPLPAGSNVLGSVAIDGSLPLPVGAATEVTALDIKSALHTIFNNIAATGPGSIKGLLSNIVSGIANIQSKIEEVSSISTLFKTQAPMSVPQMSKFSTGILSNPSCRSISVSTFMADNSSGVLTVLTSDSTDNFYSISGHTRIPIIGGQVHIFEVPLTLKYVKVEVTNPSAYNPINGLNVIVTKL